MQRGTPVELSNKTQGGALGEADSEAQSGTLGATPCCAAFHHLEYSHEHSHEHSREHSHEHSHEHSPHLPSIDYAVLIAMTAVWLIVKHISPFGSVTESDLSNPDLQNPIYPEGNIINLAMLVILSMAAPGVIYLFITLLIFLGCNRLAKASITQQSTGSEWAGTRPSSTSPILGSTIPSQYRVATFSEYLWHSHTFLRGFATCILLTTLFTDTLKIWYGRLRPDFVARCLWSTATNGCTGNPHIIDEGRRSFPSGHASSAFAGLFYFSLWLAWLTGSIFTLTNTTCRHSPFIHNIRIFGAWVNVRLTAIGAILPISALFLATYISVTRIQQRVHHPSDVVFGAAIGIVFAIWSFVSFRVKGRSSIWMRK
ncbi:hypothetical protein BSLG_002798 [Batrachochytrium salamandrivorans]|nr:hypothetical protein BSLG_002798 [Batrachochytrium salamandrivorans]